MPTCKSNTSSELYISVSDFIQDRELTGMRIQLNHAKFGTLFACVMNASGSIVYPEVSELPDLTPQQIISELYRYGFVIDYAPVAYDMSSEQIEYLMTLDRLGYDKIRYLTVKTSSTAGVSFPATCVVVFKIAQNPNWLDNRYVVSYGEYMRALAEGSALNISTISNSNQYDWSWIGDSVLSIKDVLNEISEA